MLIVSRLDMFGADTILGGGMVATAHLELAVGHREPPDSQATILVTVQMVPPADENPSKPERSDEHRPRAGSERVVTGCLSVDPKRPVEPESVSEHNHDSDEPGRDRRQHQRRGNDHANRGQDGFNHVRSRLSSGSVETAGRRQKPDRKPRRPTDPHIIYWNVPVAKVFLSTARDGE
jgi:hypothetical protein